MLIGSLATILLITVRMPAAIKRDELGIEQARELDAAVAGVEVVEVGLELEHVRDVVGAGEAEAPEDPLRSRRWGRKLGPDRDAQDRFHRLNKRYLGFHQAVSFHLLRVRA